MCVPVSFSSREDFSSLLAFIKAVKSPCANSTDLVNCSKLRPTSRAISFRISCFLPGISVLVLIFFKVMLSDCMLPSAILRARRTLQVAR
ncbi:hypothetical protein D9M72_338380 [compost metagenome]